MAAEDMRVEITDEAIIVYRPPGRTESVKWRDLRAVLIETNDLGPLVDDVFWNLVGRKGGCVVPLGIEGEQALVACLQALEGFDNEMMITAMQSHDNQRFLCWERS